MSTRKFDGRPSINNRSLTVDEHEQINEKNQDNDDQRHNRSDSNPGTIFSFGRSLIINA
jgi:hypothetical protein